MIQVDVRADIDAAVRMLNLLPNEADRAASMAINKVAASARVTAVREISREANLPQAEIRQRIEIYGSNKATLQATIRAKPWSPNLIRYQARKSPLGVIASPWHKRRVHKHTFIANKGRTVFVRMTRNRLPIKSVKGPSVRKEFMRGYALRAMQQTIAQRFPLEFERAARVVLRKYQ